MSGVLGGGRFSKQANPVRGVRWAAVGLVLALLLGACGHRFSSQTTPTPTPASLRPPSSATPEPGGIASGAASGAAGAAPGVAPASVVPTAGSFAPVTNGVCPATHPVKIDHDALAHAPGSAGYASVTPTACYATLADAEANGYATAPAR
jgi:hypothetical protein